MHSQILFKLLYRTSKLLALLLNKTMDNESLSQDWKIAYVSPIFKKGTRNKVESYRSMISIMCKLMETFVKESIIFF